MPRPLSTFAVAVALLILAASAATEVAAAELYGTVRTAGAGKAAAGATVTIQSRKADSAPISVVVDDNGYYYKSDLPKGWYDVRVAYNGASKPIRVFLKGNTPANLELLATSHEKYTWILRRR